MKLKPTYKFYTALGQFEGESDLGFSSVFSTEVKGTNVYLVVNSHFSGQFLFELKEKDGWFNTEALKARDIILGDPNNQEAISKWNESSTYSLTCAKEEYMAVMNIFFHRLKNHAMDYNNGTSYMIQDFFEQQVASNGFLEPTSLHSELDMLLANEVQQRFFEQYGLDFGAVRRAQAIASTESKVIGLLPKE